MSIKTAVKPASAANGFEAACHRIAAAICSTDGGVRDRRYVVRITCVAYVLTLLIAWRIYVPPARIFGSAPLLEFLVRGPAELHIGFLALFVVALGWLFVQPQSRAAGATVTAFTAICALRDVSSFQPYVYLYSFTIVAAVFFPGGALAALRIMVAGVYFWAGFHKLNLTFYFGIFPWVIKPFYEFSSSPTATDLAVTAVILSIPLFEAAIGVLLLFTKRTTLATVMALVMLVVVLACLAFGRFWNPAVWPWNFHLFLLELVLFYRKERTPLGPLAGVAIFLFVLAPALSIFGWWPSYQSFKLYSGNTLSAQVWMSTAEDPALLPNGIGRFVDPQLRHVLPLVDWTDGELRTIALPEIYVFTAGAPGLCPYLTYPKQARLRIISPALFYEVTTTYTETPLCP